MSEDCPHPIGDDDGTVRQCVERGHCACRHRPQPQQSMKAAYEKLIAGDPSDWTRDYRVG